MTERKAWALERGDRLPDVRAPLADGRVFVLSQDAAGVPVVFVVGAPVAPVPVVNGALITVPLPDTPHLGGMSLVDDGRVATALTGGRPGVVVAGADHRVLGVGDVGAFDQLVARLPSLVDPGPAQQRSVPLLTVDDVLDPPLCERLVAHVARHGAQPSPMVRPDGEGRPTLAVDTAVKARHDHLLDDAELATTVTGLVARRLLPEVARALAHQPRSFERLKVVRYDAGAGWFAPHRDNVTPDSTHRRLAVTINLDEGYTGGELAFPELGPGRYRPAAGAAIVFSCGLLHEVTPVLTGQRHAVITFLW